MGFGNYSHEAHEAITRARAELPRQEVFKQRACHPLMDPKGVHLRESRDSAEHPNTLSIAFALDVTGSMGDIPDLLARRELPKFMQLLLDCGIADPQLLFVAIGDAASGDRAPLQVGQFESTAELMDRWLTWSFLEGGGGSFGHESYELALYFLAQHTELDSWVKRRKRGYVFMTGDEKPYPAVSKHQIDTLISERLDEDVPVEAAVAAVQETYEPFFLIPDARRRQHCERTWRDLLGDHVLCLERPADTCYAAAGAIALTEKLVTDLDALAALLSRAGAPGDQVGSVVRALTPYAATLDRDGAASPPLEPAKPGGEGASGWRRFFGR